MVCVNGIFVLRPCQLTCSRCRIMPWKLKRPPRTSSDVCLPPFNGLVDSIPALLSELVNFLWEIHKCVLHCVLNVYAVKLKANDNLATLAHEAVIISTWVIQELSMVETCCYLGEYNIITVYLLLFDNGDLHIQPT